MSDKPLDEYLRDLVKRQCRPPMIWRLLREAADRATALIIENEELRKQNRELVNELNGNRRQTAPVTW